MSTRAPLLPLAIAALFTFQFHIRFVQGHLIVQQITNQDLDKILERADRLFEEAKTAYDLAKSKDSASLFVDAGFKLEEARIKYLVLQEIVQGEKLKIAEARLRAAHQLSKLINDGRLALSSKQAESPPTKPVAPPQKPPVNEVPANPAALAAKAVPDPAKRLPIPEFTKQRDLEKQVKELFKDQYQKKGLADRKELAKVLLQQALKSQDDPVAYWVLCREAQDAAIQASGVGLAAEAIDAAARLFDIDVLVMKQSAFIGIGRISKNQEEFAAVAEALLHLADSFISVDQFDTAEKTANAALQNARKSNEGILIASPDVRDGDEERTVLGVCEGGCRSQRSS